MIRLKQVILILAITTQFQLAQTAKKEIGTIIQGDTVIYRTDDLFKITSKELPSLKFSTKGGQSEALMLKSDTSKQHTLHKNYNCYKIHRASQKSFIVGCKSPTPSTGDQVQVYSPKDGKIKAINQLKGKMLSTEELWHRGATLFLETNMTNEGRVFELKSYFDEANEFKNFGTYTAEKEGDLMQDEDFEVRGGGSGLDVDKNMNLFFFFKRVRKLKFSNEDKGNSKVYRLGDGKVVEKIDLNSFEFFKGKEIFNVNEMKLSPVPGDSSKLSLFLSVLSKVDYDQKNYKSTFYRCFVLQDKKDNLIQDCKVLDLQNQKQGFEKYFFTNFVISTSKSESKLQFTLKSFSVTIPDKDQNSESLFAIFSITENPDGPDTISLTKEIQFHTNLSGRAKLTSTTLSTQNLGANGSKMVNYHNIYTFDQDGIDKNLQAYSTNSTDSYFSSAENSIYSVSLNKISVYQGKQAVYLEIDSNKFDSDLEKLEYSFTVDMKKNLADTTQSLGITFKLDKNQKNAKTYFDKKMKISKAADYYARFPTDNKLFEGIMKVCSLNKIEPINAFDRNRDTNSAESITVYDNDKKKLKNDNILILGSWTLKFEKGEKIEIMNCEKFEAFFTQLHCGKTREVNLPGEVNYGDIKWFGDFVVLRTTKAVKSNENQEKKKDTIFTVVDLLKGKSSSFTLDYATHGDIGEHSLEIVNGNLYFALIKNQKNEINVYKASLSDISSAEIMKKFEKEGEKSISCPLHISMKKEKFLRLSVASQCKDATEGSIFDIQLTGPDGKYFREYPILGHEFKGTESKGICSYRNLIIAASEEHLHIFNLEEGKDHKRIEAPLGEGEIRKMTCLNHGRIAIEGSEAIVLDIENIEAGRYRPYRTYFGAGFSTADDDDTTFSHIYAFNEEIFVKKNVLNTHKLYRFSFTSPDFYVLNNDKHNKLNLTCGISQYGKNKHEFSLISEVKTVNTTSNVTLSGKKSKPEGKLKRNKFYKFEDLVEVKNGGVYEYQVLVDGKLDEKAIEVKQEFSNSGIEETLISVQKMMNVGEKKVVFMDYDLENKKTIFYLKGEKKNKIVEFEFECLDFDLEVKKDQNKVFFAGLCQDEDDDFLTTFSMSLDEGKILDSGVKRSLDFGYTHVEIAQTSDKGFYLFLSNLPHDLIHVFKLQGLDKVNSLVEARKLNEGNPLI